jgi:zinc protease
LREEKGSVYGVNASGTLQKIPYSYSSFTISFPCAPENADTLTKAALAELGKVIKNGVTQDDLAKVKEQQKRKLEVDMKQNQFWTNSLFDAYFYGNDPRSILQRQKQIDELTSKMIQDVAKKYINLNKYIRTVLKPEKKDDKLKPF